MYMARNKVTSVMVDGLLRFLATGGLLTTAALAPNALQLWDKPARRFFAKLDKQAQQREYQRLLRHMRRQGLIVNSPANYEHGLRMTQAGKARAERADLEHLAIPAPPKWDAQWRIVFFDIPETKKVHRDYFSHRLRLLGFQQLQRSVWVHPFACREQVEAAATAYGVARYVTYIETGYIDAPEKLRERFTALLRSTH